MSSPKYCILIAEDEPKIAAFIVKGLTNNGYEVSLAQTGDETLQMVQSGKFDLLLLDLGLPGKDGFAVLHELRQTNTLLPIIVVSARGGSDNQLASFDRGANDYLTKPFRFQELLQRIQDQLGKQEE